MGQDQRVIEAPNFIPFPENINEPPNMRDESREVPFPADEAGFAETHEAKKLSPRIMSQQDPAWTLI